MLDKFSDHECDTPAGDDPAELFQFSMVAPPLTYNGAQMLQDLACGVAMHLIQLQPKWLRVRVAHWM